MFSGGWLQAIVTHWSVPVHFEQLSCHHHKTLSKFLVQPPYPPKKKKKVCVLLHCKICRIRTARFLAAFQWFISFIFGTKLFIFKGCRCNTQSSASKKQGHLWISLNGAPCPSSFIEPLLHNHRHQSAFGWLGVWHHSKWSKSYRFVMPCWSRIYDPNWNCEVMRDTETNYFVLWLV